VHDTQAQLSGMSSLAFKKSRLAAQHYGSSKCRSCKQSNMPYALGLRHITRLQVLVAAVFAAATHLPILQQTKIR
jgi:hypothetical protein